MIYFGWSWNLNQSFNKKVFVCKNLKNWHFHVWVEIFLHYQNKFWEQTIDLGTSTKCYKVKCFAKLENRHVAEGTLYRFHSIHRTISFDLPSVLIRFVFATSLIKTSFEAKVIKANWKLKTMLFSGSFGFMSKQCHPTTIAQLFTKNSLVQI